MPTPKRTARTLHTLARQHHCTPPCQHQQKYRWTVPRLSELYPTGDVGKDVCLMGLNKNKGQEILLRVRTDDMLGFRKYLA